MDLIKIFKHHIFDLFHENATYVSNEISKIRIDQPNIQSTKGFKTARSIVLIFDQDVIDAFKEAEDSQLKELTNYKYSLRRLITNRMAQYDSDGDKSTAFQIHIDSRALVL